MHLTGNTILVTGGASGIGRGLAEAFHQRGNQVIIAGRRQAALDAVIAANPGMAAMALDVADPTGITRFAARLAAAYPALDVLVNNAGMAQPEALTTAPAYLAAAEATVVTNLLGPIRLTAALLPLLLGQARATVMMVTSGLGFVPMAAMPTYCATKAALHSYAMSLRQQLRDTSTGVIEIPPPYVQTELGGPAQAADPRAMPLDDFIAEVMDLLTSQPKATEIVVERCKQLRFAAENGQMEQVFAMMSGMEV